MEQRGSIRVSRDALAATAGFAAASVPGVVRLWSDVPPWLRWLLDRGHPRALLGRRGAPSGVRVHLHPDGLSVEVSIVVRSGTDLLAVAAQVRREVAKAVETATHHPVRDVHVHIQDVQDAV